MSTYKRVNHWGVWVESDKPITGVLSNNSIAWECMDEDICLTCHDIIKAIESDDSLDEDQKENELEFVECDSDHTKLYGGWIQDKDGLYEPDTSSEYSAIGREFTLQIVWSLYTSNCALCSPCYPGQGDLGTPGEFIAYTLPDELIWHD